MSIEWVKARDIAKHPTIHRMAPITEKDRTPNVNSAKGERSLP